MVAIGAPPSRSLDRFGLLDLLERRDESEPVVEVAVGRLSGCKHPGLPLDWLGVVVDVHENVIGQRPVVGRRTLINRVVHQLVI